MRPTPHAGVGRTDLICPHVSCERPHRRAQARRRGAGVATAEVHDRRHTRSDGTVCCAIPVFDGKRQPSSLMASNTVSVQNRVCPTQETMEARRDTPFFSDITPGKGKGGHRRRVGKVAHRAPCLHLYYRAASQHLFGAHACHARLCIAKIRPRGNDSHACPNNRLMIPRGLGIWRLSSCLPHTALSPARRGLVLQSIDRYRV